MKKLNFPSYQFRIKNSENRKFIFDTIRKKFVVLTPEEWVRQHTVRYLLEEKLHPKSLLTIEKKVLVNGMDKRYDILTYTNQAKIHLVVECKAPSIKITQETFDQIARYNLTLQSKYLMVTNGLNHYYCSMNYKEGRYQFLPSLPTYQLEPTKSKL